MSQVGIVIIGRNEGERLMGCLRSVTCAGGAPVYVDSGSTDGSVLAAKEAGAAVVELDRDVPFTAARARNAGLEKLLQLRPDVLYVQFVDGDCEVVGGWLERGRTELEARPDAAVVCGRRRERFPGATIYNRLCDLEWNTPVGEATACGGDAMMRVKALQEVGGYDPAVIAGEEPELCVRLRQRGWRIFRADAEMTLHDAAMTRPGQWWKRSLRAGHAYAQGAAMHGASPQRHWVRETRSIWAWGVVFPVSAAALAWPSWGLSLPLLLVAYGLLSCRIYRNRRRAGWSAADARLYAVFCTLAKLPQALGQVRFHLRRLLGRPSTLIEYKGMTPERTEEQVGA